MWLLYTQYKLIYQDWARSWSPSEQGTLGPLPTQLWHSAILQLKPLSPDSWVPLTQVQALPGPHVSISWSKNVPKVLWGEKFVFLLLSLPLSWGSWHTGYRRFQPRTYTGNQVQISSPPSSCGLWQVTSLIQVSVFSSVKWWSQPLP
jgi:hypothetical protein